MGGVRKCPKCGGDIFLDWDIGDGVWYEYCLQCAYRHYLPPLVKEKSESSTGRNTKRRRKRREK